jgi:hypothetical protein
MERAKTVKSSSRPPRLLALALMLVPFIGPPLLVIAVVAEEEDDDALDVEAKVATRLASSAAFTCSKSARAENAYVRCVN